MDFNHSNSLMITEEEKWRPRPEISLEEIRVYYCMPIKQAAKEMNVGLTRLKMRCRELGITRWPHRKMKSLKSLISNVLELGVGKCKESTRRELETLEELMQRMEDNPQIQLTGKTKRLQQLFHKANYMKKRGNHHIQHFSYEGTPTSLGVNQHNETSVQPQVNTLCQPTLSHPYLVIQNSSSEMVPPRRFPPSYHGPYDRYNRSSQTHRQNMTRPLSALVSNTQQQQSHGEGLRGGYRDLAHARAARGRPSRPVSQSQRCRQATIEAAAPPIPSPKLRRSEKEAHWQGMDFSPRSRSPAKNTLEIESASWLSLAVGSDVQAIASSSSAISQDEPHIDTPIMGTLWRL